MCSGAALGLDGGVALKPGGGDKIESGCETGKDKVAPSVLLSMEAIKVEDIVYLSTIISVSFIFFLANPRLFLVGCFYTWNMFRKKAF